LKKIQLTEIVYMIWMYDKQYLCHYLYRIFLLNIESRKKNSDSSCKGVINYKELSSYNNSKAFSK